MDTLNAIKEAILSVKDVYLLHMDPGKDAYRTVFTFFGEAEAVGEAAFRAVMVAREKIDMRTHHGEHPRMGACDVCPFVPLGETSMEIAMNIASKTAKRLGKEGIPVYLYEKSATRPEREKLENIRKGEYESISQKLQIIEHWMPDEGPSTFNEKFGMMALGARNFLVAYNVNIESKEVKIAREIAGIIRESGFKKPDGTQSKGLFKGLKAIGWWMESYQCIQVSTNITDIHQCSAVDVFESIKILANERGCSTRGSELIGLIPQKALLKKRQNVDYMEENIELLGLNAVSTFIPEERILEKIIFNKTGIQL